MAQSDYQQGNFTTPKNGYKVSEMTSLIIDCIRMHDAMFSKVSDALDTLYCDFDAEKRMNEKDFPQWSNLEELLYEDLKFSIEDNLADLTNVQNENEITL